MSKAQSLIGSIVKANLITSGLKAAASAVKDFAASAVETYTTFNQSMANAAAIAGATAIWKCPRKRH